MTVCVFAITGSAGLSGVSAVGERLRVVRVGRLAAIVRECRRAPSVSAAGVLRFHAVQQKLGDRLPAMLPARFGTVMDASELEFVLRSRAAALSTALKHVRERVQMTVRLVEARETGPAISRRRAGESGPASAPLRMRSGTAYLRGLAEAASRARRVAGFEPVRDAIDRFVRDERVERRARVVSIYHLVPRRSVQAYVRAARAAATAAGLPLAISGPFPPYAFTAL